MNRHRMAVERVKSALNLTNRIVNESELVAIQRLAEMLQSTCSHTRKRAIETVHTNLGFYGRLEDYLELSDKPKTKYSKRMIRCLGVAAEDQKKSRIRSHVWRCSQEADELLKEGWYLIFDTLTVDRSTHDPEEIWKSNAWKSYYDSVRRAVKEACGIKRLDKDPINTYFRHFGALQLGKDRENIHLHILLFCREIPDTWKNDPNQHRRLANAREINELKSHWSYGYSSPVALRTGYDDSWGKLGWCIPVDQDGKPIKIGNSQSVAAYIARYLLHDNGDLWKTRIRMSQRLGLNRLIKALKSIPTKYLRPLTEAGISQIWLDHYQHQLMIPTRLLVSRAKSERLARCWGSKPIMTASMRLAYRTPNFLGTLSKALDNLNSQKKWSVCRTWLYEVIMDDSLVYDNRQHNAYQHLLDLLGDGNSITIKSITGKTYA